MSTHLYVSNCGLPFGPSNRPSSPSRSQNTTSPPGVCSRLAVKSIKRTLQLPTAGQFVVVLGSFMPGFYGPMPRVRVDCKPNCCAASSLMTLERGAIPPAVARRSTHLAPSARTRMLQPFSRAVTCVSCGGLSMMLPQCRSLCSKARASSATASARAVCDRNTHRTLQESTRTGQADKDTCRHRIGWAGQRKQPTSCQLQ